MPPVWLPFNGADNITKPEAETETEADEQTIKAKRANDERGLVLPEAWLTSLASLMFARPEQRPHTQAQGQTHTSDTAPPIYGNSSSRIQVLSIAIVGSDVQGKPLIVPCLLPGTFCPYEAARLTASPALFAVNVSFQHLPYALSVDLPDIFVDVKCCVFSQLISLNSKAIRFSSSQPVVTVFVSATPVDLPLLQQAVVGVNEGVADVTLRISGSNQGTFISRVASLIDYKVTIPKSKSAAAGGPAPYKINYHLVSTTTSSATFAIAIKDLNNPTGVSWDLGPVDIFGSYSGVEIARSNIDFKLNTGRNNFDLLATIHGEQPLRLCVNSTLPDKSFCKANEVLSRVNLATWLI